VRYAIWKWFFAYRILDVIAGQFAICGNPVPRRPTPSRGAPMPTTTPGTPAMDGRRSIPLVGGCETIEKPPRHFSLPHLLSAMSLNVSGGLFRAIRTAP
jgi:hypothetical protein